MWVIEKNFTDKKCRNLIWLSIGMAIFKKNLQLGQQNKTLIERYIKQVRNN